MHSRSKKRPRCEIAVLLDEEVGEWSKAGEFVPDLGSMERRIVQVLRSRYRGVKVVPFRTDIVATMTELRRLKPRMVFNLTEWLAGDRKADHAIAGLLEIMQLRFTGTGQIGLQLCRNKALAKQLVAAAGVDVALSFSVAPRQRIADANLSFPMIVKPQFGDGSDHISKAALVKTPSALRARVKALHQRVRELVLCEEFIAGRDIYVGVIGNSPPRVLAPTQMVVMSREMGAPKFATYRLKNDVRYRAKWKVRYGLAQLPRGVMRTLKEFSSTAFRVLELRDYARIDFRLSEGGRLVFIEANPNPDLTPHTLGRNLCFAGIRYQHLIPRIVETARRRYPGRKSKKD